MVIGQIICNNKKHGFLLNVIKDNKIQLLAHNDKNDLLRQSDIK